MGLKLVDYGYLQQACHRSVGGGPGELSSLTELIRQELWAVGLQSRRMLCERTAERIRPLVMVTVDTLRDILDEMDRTGDLTIGPGGIVAAVPLRIVSCSAGRYRLFGTLPNRYLLEHVKHIHPVGTAREVITDSVAELDDVLTRFGGIHLSVERWAGFDRIPAAGTDWLQELNFRLVHEAEKAGAFDSRVRDVWRVYRLADGNPQKGKSLWKNPRPDDDGQLWQGWSSEGRPIAVWTSGGNPASFPCMRLTRDEACRAGFSLDIRAGSPRIIQANPSESGTEMILETMLPLAEYRYLMIMGELKTPSDRQRVFNISSDDWPAVADTLFRRLGVIIHTTGT